MALKVARFINLLFTAPVAGIFVAVWMVESALHGLSGPVYTALHQPMNRIFGPVMPPLMTLAIVSGLAILLLLPRLQDLDLRAYLRWGPLQLLNRDLELARQRADQPGSASWSIQSPPADWAQLRDRWVVWHNFRTVLSVVALS